MPGESVKDQKGEASESSLRRIFQECFTRSLLQYLGRMFKAVALPFTLLCLYATFEFWPYFGFLNRRATSWTRGGVKALGNGSLAGVALLLAQKPSGGEST